MVIELEAAGQQLEELVARTKQECADAHDYKLQRLNEDADRIRTRCEEAIAAAEELASMDALAVLERGIAYRSTVEVRDEYSTYAVGRDTEGYIKVKSVPKGKYKALILLIPAV